MAIVDGQVIHASDVFDATVPVTQAFSDAAATGSATVAARRDHRHGMMAAPATSDPTAKKVVTQIAQITTANETTVATWTVPGGTLGTNGFIRVKMFGNCYSNVSSNTLIDVNIKLKFGGTTVANIVPRSTGTGGAYNVDWQAEGYLKGAGATNSQWGSLWGTINSQADQVQTLFQKFSSGSAAIDSTANADLVVTVKNDSGGAVLTLDVHYVTIEFMAAL